MWILITWPRKLNERKNFNKRETTGTHKYWKQIITVNFIFVMSFSVGSNFSELFLGIMFLQMKKRKLLSRIFCLSWFLWS